jgi:hypothetical protein
MQQLSEFLHPLLIDESWLTFIEKLPSVTKNRHKKPFLLALGYLPSAIPISYSEGGGGLWAGGGILIIDSGGSLGAGLAHHRDACLDVSVMGMIWVRFGSLG